MGRKPAKPEKPGDDVFLFVPFGVLPPQGLREILKGRKAVDHARRRGVLVGLGAVLAACYRVELEVVTGLIKSGDVVVEPPRAKVAALRSLARAEGRPLPPRDEAVAARREQVAALVHVAGLTGPGADPAEALAGEAVQHVYTVAPIPEDRENELLMWTAPPEGPAQKSAARAHVTEEMSYFLSEPSTPSRAKLAAGGALMLLLAAVPPDHAIAEDRCARALRHALGLADLDARIRTALWRHEHGTLGRLGAVASAEDLLADAGTTSGGRRRGRVSPATTEEMSAARATRSEDFSTVDWYGSAHRFNATQARAVALLWAEWEKGGLGLNEATVGDALDSQSDSYRLAHTFRNRGAPHPAWGTMIVRVERGVYALRAPGARITK